MRAELPIGAFIAAFVVLIPSSWHWRARSIPTLSMIAWLFLDNLILGINSIIWSGNVKPVVPLWCDIVTRLEHGSTVALPAACLCLCIRLERISSARNATTTQASKSRWMWFDVALCWGLPVVYVGLYYIVQGHRFDIVEDLGCRATFYVSVASLFLVMLPPLVLSVATLIFAAISLVHFFRRRIDFNRHLQKSGSALTTARYFRLMLMSMVLMTWTLTVSSLDVWFSLRRGFRPWTSWADVHSNWLQIGQFPWVFISPSDKAWTIALWWTLPVSAYINAAFFVFGEDAMREYAKWCSWVRVHIFRKKRRDALLPGYIHALDSMPSARKQQGKRETFTSFSVDNKLVAPTTVAKPILSSAALRSFATDDTDASEPYSPMPSTPSDYSPPDYDSEQGGHHIKVPLDNPFRTHDMA